MSLTYSGVARIFDRAESFSFHQFRKTDDRIQRRAQFMAHICEEFRLCLVGRLRKSPLMFELPGLGGLLHNPRAQLLHRPGDARDLVFSPPFQ